MPNFTLSALVATYNSNPEYLRKALDSALNQTLPSVQIVISDDSTNDTVSNIVKSYASDRISYQKNNPSLGVAANHRAALARAQAPLVAVLNHDDFWEPRFAEVLVQALHQNPEAVMAFCDHWIVDAQGERMEARTEDNTRYWKRDSLSPGLHKPFYDLFAAGTIPSAMGAVFRKDALAYELPSEAGPAYDLWLTFLLCCQSGGAVYEPERLSNWRTHPESITTQGSTAWSLGEAKCWMAVLQQDNLSSIHAQARVKASSAFRAAAMTKLRQDDKKQALALIQQALAVQPSLKARIIALLCLLPKPLTKPLLHRLS